MAPNDRIRLGLTELDMPAVGISVSPSRALNARAAYQAAMDGGLSFFSTRETLCGSAERLLGACNTAAEFRPIVATTFNPLLPFRFRAGALTTALRHSLDCLRLDAVDLYQIQTPYSLAPMITWLDALTDAVKAGLVHAAGVCHFSAIQLVFAHAALGKRGVALASHQVTYSLLHRAPETNGVLEVCRDLGVTLIADMPLAHGLLAGTGSHEQPPQRALQPLIDTLRHVGAAHGGRTPAQVALNWIICKGVMPVVEVRRAEQAAEIAGALGWRLSADEQAELDAASNTV